MKKLLLQLVLLVSVTVAHAQSKSVTGKVTDVADGSSLAGVSIVIKGTTSGTITDADGKYAIDVDSNQTLVFSFVGFVTEEIPVGERSVINVNMTADITQLSDVVVTAFGISREKKSLTYAADQFEGDELTQAKDASFINALAGKTAGVQINRSGSGVGGSTRVILRGNSSTRDNNVLYVIDGVPMLNYTTFQPATTWGEGNDGSGGAGRDGGDAISNLNPEDIESMTVLKGASAAALYGSQAANGVILITTKSGKKGQARVTLSSNYTSESILIKPELQYKYGQTKKGSLDSWGGNVNAPDHVTDFFQNANTWINSIAISGGNEKAQTYFSYANTNSTGLIPTTTFDKHNFNFKETGKFFNDKLNVSANINYIMQKGHNRATSGLYFNPLTGLYQFPRGLDFNTYKNKFEVNNKTRNLNAQNWIADKDTQQNPYWILNRNQTDDSRTRTILNASVQYDFTDAISVRLKGTIDNTNDLYEQKAFATTQGTLADANGRYVWQRNTGIQKYGEIALMYNKTWEELSLSATLGSTINDTEVTTEFIDTKGAGKGLSFANVFSLQNIAQPGATFKQSANNSQLQAVFGSVNLGYKGMLFLDITGRNDWSSTLAFTDNVSFFYPSFGLTGIISEMVELPDAFNLLKLRASYAQVGNGVSPFDTNVLIPIVKGQRGAVQAIVEPGKSLKPEKQTSLEFGLELAMIDNRLSLDFTYYKNNTTDQRVRIATSAASNKVGASQFFVNAGEIENKGIEVGLTGNPVKTDDFSWEVGLNYASNTNTVISLHKDLKRFVLTEPRVNSYLFAISKGGSFGDIYGKKFLRKNGKIVVDDKGKPKASKDYEKVGNINPDFNMGLVNNLTYKRFNLSFLIDGRFGGEVMSLTEAMNDELGVSQTTANARDAGKVNVDVVREDGSAFTGTINPQTWYTTVGGRAGISEYYMYSATNIRLRELSLGYKIPVDNIGYIQSAKLSIVGRNLFFIKNDAPFDPDVAMSTGNGLQGVHTYALPSTRSIGVNLTVTF